MTATQLLVVPRSIPITLAMYSCLFPGEPGWKPRSAVPLPFAGPGSSYYGIARLRASKRYIGGGFGACKRAPGENPVREAVSSLRLAVRTRRCDLAAVHLRDRDCPRVQPLPVASRNPLLCRRWFGRRLAALKPVSDAPSAGLRSPSLVSPAGRPAPSDLVPATSSVRATTSGAASPSTRGRHVTLPSDAAPGQMLAGTPSPYDAAAPRSLMRRGPQRAHLERRLSPMRHLPTYLDGSSRRRRLRRPTRSSNAPLIGQHRTRAIARQPRTVSRTAPR